MSTVIIRHGHNTANTQGVIAVLPTRKEAKQLLPKIECYNNQHLELVALSKLSTEERQQAQELDIIETLACCGREMTRWELQEIDHGAYLCTGKCQKCWERQRGK